MPKSRICSIEGCGKPYRSRGYCESHYRFFMSRGTPERKGNDSPARDFFFNVVVPYDKDDCLIWPFSRCEKGYARMRRIKGFKGNAVYRLADQVINGVPENLKYDAAHTCGNGHLGCCNPRHVLRCTRAINRSHMKLHGTQTYGEDTSNARLTREQVLEIRRLFGTISQNKIAKMYNVGVSTIWAIKAKRSWAWLD